MSILAYTFSHWLHLLSIVMAVGGTIVLRFVVCPKIPDNETGWAFRQAILGRWKKIVWVLIAVILITGLINFARVAQDGYFDLKYSIVFLVKILLALKLFAIAFMLTLPFKGFAKYKEKRDKWLFVMATLGVIILLLSSYLRHLQTGNPLSG